MVSDGLSSIMAGLYRSYRGLGPKVLGLRGPCQQ